jgi:peptide-methionine (R)-S-oxide reductase
MEKVKKTEADWRAELTSEEYRVTREKGTEPAFSGRYWNEHTKGTYNCRCCGQSLFRSETKFDSGSGWPSFWQPMEGADIESETDLSYGMLRTEVMCGRCEAHLGHVFDDGPLPTGLRYCINSESLNLEPDEAPDSED